MAQLERPGAARVYVVLRGVAAFAGTVAFSVAPLYRIRSVGLSPFQLVLVGTVMEMAVLVSEVPTGVVADVLSRKWSVIVGHAGMGAAIVAEGCVPTLTGVLLAQAGWGLAYTFTSGATEAWVSGELDGASGRDAPASERDLAGLFLRAARWGSVAAVVAIPVAFGLASFGLRVPLLVGGAVQVALAGWLAVVMREDHFTATPPGGRSTLGHLWTTLRAGAREIAGQRALVWLAVVLLVAGGASEAYDRLTERRFLVDVGFPRALGGSSLTWFTIIFVASALTGITVPALVERAAPARDRRRLGRWMVGLYLAQVVAIAVFGLTVGFVAAVAAVVVVDRARNVRESLTSAWIIPLTSTERRATVLSALGQFDAFGQMLIGPAFGIVASRAGVGPALVVSAAVMAPGVLALVAAGRVPSPGAVPGATAR